MFHLFRHRRVVVSFSLATFLLSSPLSQADEIEITPSGDAVLVTIGGEPFTKYNFQNTPKPYLYPVLGPGNLPMTRGFPMHEKPYENTDHPHHRSLWWAHGDINGVDFWSESDRAGKIVHERFVTIQSGEQVGILRSHNRLESPDGELVANAEQTIYFSGTKARRVMDFEVRIQALEEQDLVFGDTKEGTMAVRLAPTLRLNGPVATGTIRNSEGVTDGDTWGKRANWCDYYGTITGRTVGVAIFDWKNNPRNPTWWHVRDYGLFAANPFGVHDFERKPAGTGDFTVPAGDSVTFRYRLLFHEGTTEEAGIAREYESYITRGDMPRHP